MQSQHHHWLDDPRPGKIPPLFQALIKRIASRLPLVESVLEVARYAEHSGLDEYWGWFIQGCPNIPEEVLNALANAKRRSIFVGEGWEDWMSDSWGWWVATRSQDLPEGVLKALAQDENWAIRKEIAKRGQKLPEEILRVLAQDEISQVRYAAARRSQALPDDILVALAQDEDWHVQNTIANRKQTPSQQQEESSCKTG